MNGITVNNVQKSFGETRALHNANLVAAMGEVHAIVGENGSGKSTLAKIISGVFACDAGEVSLLGQTPKNPQHTLSLGAATIFQEMMLAEQLSIFENMFAGSDGLWRKRSSQSEKRTETKMILERLSGQVIDPDARVADLPLHLKQWIVLGRAIRLNPKVLILDESSAALDLEGTERLHTEIRRLRNDGTCVIIVTHRIAELVKIADRATVLRDGATVGELEKTDITEHNLLSLMSADSRKPDDVQRSGGIEALSRKTMLRCQGIQLQAGATPFDFYLKAGEIVGVAGLDGAGQTEFVRALAGISPSPAGYVEAVDASDAGTRISSVADAGTSGVAYVSGDRKREGIFPSLSTFENFSMSLYGRHKSKIGIIDRRNLLKIFGSEKNRLSIKTNALSDRITVLSGGNQQKVLIARAFANHPNVIVLNDPARGVDIGTKQELYRQLTAFAQRGGAVVYLSSETEEFLGFADRVAVFVGMSLFDTVEEDDLGGNVLLHAMFGRKSDVLASQNSMEQAL
jgi:ABC-type sugar transport system ATPase subunit